MSERFDIDVGYRDPWEYADDSDAELDAREERMRERDDAKHEACARHYPNPSMTCPACGS